MICWNCHKKLPEFNFGKVPFRAECEFCRAALHSCQNCIHHKLNLPNECDVPNTDFVKDKTAPNLCEDFKILGIASKSSYANPDDVAKRLFGD